MTEHPLTPKRLKRLFKKFAAAVPPRLPVSTYRLQFNKYFRFVDACRILPYLHELGITDIYASPFFQSRPGSMHGYDITDYCRLNPEIGTEEEFEEYVSTLRRYGMGQILDIVPNHMSIGGSSNRWWQDVLENGQSSPYASYFDIDWKPLKEELEDKVILPILGDQYGRVLENGELHLSLAGGGFQVTYYEHRLPLDPKTYPRIFGNDQDLEELGGKMGAENENYQELLSIITALNNLPDRRETDPARMAERRREKEVIKRRLDDLNNRNAAIRELIDIRVQLYNGERGVPASFDDLDALLSDQAFRLAYWRVATEEINYRRFFDINDLAAVRMENPEVFQEAHALVFEWVREGKVTGLRVDHPDGLYNPTAYFRSLQEECFIQLCRAALGPEPKGNEKDAIETMRSWYRNEILEIPGTPLKRPFYMVGEKILMDGEPMPPYWPIYGATGYVFMNAVNGIFIDRGKVRTINRIYTRFTGENRPFAELQLETKKLIMRSSMASEINVLGRSLNRISEKDRHYRDFTLNNLTQAIVEVIAFFPIYRTYIDSRGIADRDRRYLEEAIARAKRASRDLSGSIFDFLRDVLLGRYPERSDEAVQTQCFEFIMKFQQLTGPVMAKGLEDTAFYIYNRFVSLNEVGGNPARFGLSPNNFHALNGEKIGTWPHTLLATSTHDSKRSEDVRARINVLSEIPEQWHEHLHRWSRRNRRWKTMVDGEAVPERNTEYLLYQTLVGAWPLTTPTGEEFISFVERINQYMLKAAREAKTHTSWINQNGDYEEALTRFIENVLRSRSFLDDFLSFQNYVSRYGLFNSLAQTLLKIASPGTPDFFQGTELWTLTLVDPDNRTPVDYEAGATLLAELKERERTTGLPALAEDLTRWPADNRIKLFLTHKALTFRRKHQQLFTEGEYIPATTGGIHGRRVVSFLRRLDYTAVLVAVPRLLIGLGLKNGQPPIGEIWSDTILMLPDSEISASFRNVFTGETVTAGRREGQATLIAAEVFARFPMALLQRI
jgi:(1->4)-alpha-D-glucan 1-alpha-D-glucosylmutase